MKIDPLQLMHAFHFSIRIGLGVKIDPLQLMCNIKQNSNSKTSEGFAQLTFHFCFNVFEMSYDMPIWIFF